MRKVGQVCGKLGQMCHYLYRRKNTEMPDSVILEDRKSRSDAWESRSDVWESRSDVWFSGYLYSRKNTAATIIHLIQHACYIILAGVYPFR